MVSAELDLMRAALAVTPAADHLVLLSGADYPLRPVKEFENFLSTAPYRQHIRAFAIDRATGRGYTNQIRRYWWLDELLPWRMPDRMLRKLLNETVGRAVVRRPPNRPVQGLSWWAITADCASTVVEISDNSPQLERFYRHVWSSDEKFVHGIVHGSTYGNDTKDGGLMPFAGRGQWRLTNFHLIHPSLTKFYTVQDLDEVLASDQFFVRKVRTDFSEGLLDLIDRERNL
jgi:Core-2/I-Branching enzyme